jgi:VCBS repeat-containing protein
MSEVSMRAGARWAVCAVFAFLTACGGGGGGGDDGGSSPPPGSPPPGSPPPGSGNPPPGATNGPPQFGTTSFSGTEDADLSATLTATDPNSDPVTFERTGDPSSGTVVSFTAAGAFVYRPSANFNGSDSFAVRAVDSQNNATAGTVSISIAGVNDAPVAANDVLRADGPQLNGLDLLANDSDPDGDPLTLTIEQGPLVGTATVTSDRRVRIEGLPAGFRGLTRFRYRISDSSSAAASANAAIFVGTDPFRVVFAGETDAPGAAEVYMTDFVSAPWRATLATQGSLRLRGFAASDNGATVVYRRENAGSSDLSFVRTTTSDATADQQVRIALPSGFIPAVDVAGVDQFTVSPDGQWIATVARSGNEYAVFALNVTAPMSVRDVTPDDARFATQPRFSANSQRLYFLGSERDEGDGRKSLYRIDLGSSSNDPTVLSAAYAPMSPGDITRYSVSSDERRIALEATRNGRLGVFFIDPASPRNEVPLNHSLAFDEGVIGTTVGMDPSQGGSTNLERVGYTARRFLVGTIGAYVAEVGASPNPRIVAGDGARAVAFRPDNDAMLYSRDDGAVVIHEAVIDSTAPHEIIGPGSLGVPDATGNTVVLRQALPPNDYPALAVAMRGSFGAPTAIGSPGQAAWLSNLSGASRAVVLIGEAPPGTGPRTLRLSLVNARAPDKVLTLAEFNTPNDLTSAPARIVTY